MVLVVVGVVGVVVVMVLVVGIVLVLIVIVMVVVVVVVGLSISYASIYAVLSGAKRENRILTPHINYSNLTYLTSKLWVHQAN